MNRRELVEFLRAQKWAVEASVTTAGAPQAAVIGVAVTDDLELVFDTVTDTRKAVNLRADPRIALVMGWDEGKTAQIEGVADEPAGEDLKRLKHVYLTKFPDGLEREQWPNITYFRVRPTWIRFSDFTVEPPAIELLAL
ncbi:MAG: pyridoxamine 5'-phosphate oxidase family protein [Labilithrix sp.]|nr:pyridoxamine 5'-phosphate oxidase family protein [Labilithrix sp.]MCW5809726.1 pyridoxamine 5'-phosphate oxidase family protein [Labilithrix sp.]